MTLITTMIMISIILTKVQIQWNRQLLHDDDDRQHYVHDDDFYNFDKSTKPVKPPKLHFAR